MYFLLFWNHFYLFLYEYEYPNIFKINAVLSNKVYYISQIKSSILGHRSCARPTQVSLSCKTYLGVTFVQDPVGRHYCARLPHYIELTGRRIWRRKILGDMNDAQGPIFVVLSGNRSSEKYSIYFRRKENGATNSVAYQISSMCSRTVSQLLNIWMFNQSNRSRRCDLICLLIIVMLQILYVLKFKNVCLWTVQWLPPWR